MRIIAGEFRGRRLASIGGGRRQSLRPTSDRVRESLFSILAGHMVLNGARVLDVFAGTGALGLEALSRGAKSAVFVDNGKSARDLLKRNISICDADGRARILDRDAIRPGINNGAPYNLMFMDPPYGRGLGEAALKAAVSGGWISEHAVIAWEEGVNVEIPSSFGIIDERRYGSTQIKILEYGA
ncbi:MAG: 16S rRNA (guanine(966)-N(2))-methyltransferase RsmD [Roseovarius sp.]|nr:16S rRNA (guanine(966)-N(2))-methyltransferase RsmD [Roseovarius sp.]MCY4208961.1 16S rRNA (guanine(966)-N(2))-methyltransferase RsmD [Roseovarius sp.]MCY4315483.1 16S rRNA (guanine(966)-N(2))-methyltransferase RsmD [Roseovarius sp.]